MLPIEKEIIQVMSQVFCVPEDRITPTSSVHSVDKWDSLRHMQLMVALEQKFGFQLTDDEVVSLKSFAQIQEAVTKRQR